MNLKLRPVREDDCELLFNWVNDPKVRANSFDQSLIKIKNHKTWFKKNLKEGIPWFILDTDQSNSGVIRFDKSEDKYKISFMIANEFRGKGLGKEIIKLGLEVLNKSNLNHTLVFGLVKKKNIASIKSFLANQFSQNEYNAYTLLFKRYINL
jgi:predicted acetyltransferase